MVAMTWSTGAAGSMVAMWSTGVAGSVGDDLVHRRGRLDGRDDLIHRSGRLDGRDDLVHRRGRLEVAMTWSTGAAGSWSR